MKPLTHLFVDFENHQPPAEAFARLHAEECRIWLFHGPHQNKFAADLVAAWQPLGPRVRFVQSSKPGKNALDFHVAFALGLAHQENSARGRDARYVVVSRDNGFDALFDHMRSLGAAVGRAETIADALALAASLTVARSADSSPEPAPVLPPVKHTAEAAAQAPAKPKPPAQPPKPAAKKTAAKTAPAKKSKAAPRDTLAQGDVDKVIAGLRARPAQRPTNRSALERHILPLLRNQVTLKVGQAIVKKLEERKAITFSGNKIEYTLPSGKK